jgi:hypothetical protein
MVYKSRGDLQIILSFAKKERAVALSDILP